MTETPEDAVTWVRAGGMARELNADPGRAVARHHPPRMATAVVEPGALTGRPRIRHSLETYRQRSGPRPGRLDD